MSQSNEMLAFHVDGKIYSSGDLTLGDLAAIEEEWGQSWGEIEASPMSIKLVLWIIWLIRKKTEPELTIDEVGNIKLTTFFDSAEAEEEDPLEEGSEDA